MVNRVNDVGSGDWISHGEPFTYIHTHTHDMGRDADKHIRVTEETWKQLNQRKEPGDSFNDVLQRLIEEKRRESDQGNPSRAAAE